MPLRRMVCMTWHHSGDGTILEKGSERQPHGLHAGRAPAPRPPVRAMITPSKHLKRLEERSGGGGA